MELSENEENTVSVFSVSVRNQSVCEKAKLNLGLFTERINLGRFGKRIESVRIMNERTLFIAVRDAGPCELRCQYILVNMVTVSTSFIVT